MRDLKGEKFGTFTVLEFESARINGTYPRWLCQCACGNKKICFITQIGKMCEVCQEKPRGSKPPYYQKKYQDIPRSFYTNIKSNARHRGIEFDITIEDIWELFLKQNKKCFYTGQPLSFPSYNEKGTASVDRADNTKGYTKDNITLVTKQINFCKQTLSPNDFVNLCKQVTNHFNYRTA